MLWYEALVERVSSADWSHAELAAAFRGFARVFPENGSAARGAEIARAYEAWTDVIPSAPGGTLGEEMGRTIKRLQRSPHALWSGWPDQEGLPAERASLARFEAVPFLLALVGSLEPTRMVRIYSSGKGQYRDSRQLSALGELVTDLLREVASGALDEEWKDRPETLEARREKFRKRAEAWWAGVSEKGELAILEERVAMGAEGVQQAASRLLLLDPARGIRAIGALIDAAKSPWPSAGLVRLLGTRTEQAATDALVKTFDGSSSPRLRLEAAQALHARGHAPAVPAMLAEWDNPSEQPIQQDVGLPADPGFARDLMSFLTGSGDVRAYRALSARRGTLPASWRFTIVSNFLSRLRRDHSRGATDLALSPGAAHALEDLLAGQLAEHEGASGVHMSIGGGSVETRLGHAAARALSVQFPTLYSYEARASSRLRERMRHAARNTWRKRAGLPALPALAERPVPKPLGAEVVQPLLERVRTAVGKAERKQATAAVEKLGVAALPAMLRALAAAPDKTRRELLEVLVSRQAAIVTEITLTEGSPEPPASLQALLEGMRNRPLDGPSYIALMLHITQGRSKGVEGIRVRAARGDDLTGVSLRLTVLVHRQDDGMNSGGWTYGTPIGGHGTSVYTYGQKAEDWKDEAADLEFKLSAPATDDVVMSFYIVREVRR